MMGVSTSGGTALVVFGIASGVFDRLATALVCFASSVVHDALPAAHHIAHTAVQEMLHTSQHIWPREQCEHLEGVSKTQLHGAAALFVSHTMKIAVNSFANKGPLYTLCDREKVLPRALSQLWVTGTRHIPNEKRERYRVKNKVSEFSIFR